MMLALLFKSLRDRYRSIGFWALGLIAIAGIQLFIYPSVKETAAEMEAFIKAFPPALVTIFRIQDYTTASGFLGTELYSLMVPIIFIAVGANWAAAATAEEEERGTAEILFTLPIRRWQILASKTMGLLIVLLFLTVVIISTILIGGAMVDLKVAFDKLVAVTLACFAIGFFFSGFAMLVATLTGKKGASVGAAIGLAIITFFLFSLAPLVDTFDAILPYNPFQWALGEDPLRNGFDFLGLTWLASGGLALYAAATWRLAKKDIGV